MTTTLTNTGIAIAASVPWGTHLCHFYETKQDLLDVLVPYFKAGLDNDELCVWLTSDPLAESEARAAMVQAVPGFDGYLERRQMQIVPSSEWYRSDGSFTAQTAAGADRNRTSSGAKKRYAGLRATGCAGSLCHGGWEDWALTICSFPLALFGVRESLDVMARHQLALIKHDGVWQSVENAAHGMTAEAQTETKDIYRNLFERGQHANEVSADQAFEDIEQRYRLLADNASDVIWVTDLNLRPVYFSPSTTRLLGYTVAEAMEGNLDTALAPDSLERALAAFHKAIDWDAARPGGASKAGTLELQFRRKDGSLVWVEATVSFLRDSRGKPVRILGILHDISRRKQAEEQLQHSLDTLERTVESAIQAIASTVETKDVYTAGHQRRVTALACAIAREMGLSGDTLHVIRTAGLLHDLGKISLPTDILTKPGQLTKLELAVIRTHPQVAYDVLKNIEGFDRIALAVLQHHERMNGTGYPSGIDGEKILLEARILAVSDVIEAMFSYRPYRPALGLQKALEEVSRNSGSLYDRDVVDACLAIFRQGRFKFAEA